MTNWVSTTSGTVRRHWIVPRSVMCALFWSGVILVFTGMILLVTSIHKGKMYKSWGAVLLGLGLCFLFICLILCIHAYCVISAVSRAELREKSLSKRGVEEEETTLRPYLAAAMGTASAILNGPKPRAAVGGLVAPPKFDVNIQPQPKGTGRLSGITAGAVTTIPIPSLHKHSLRPSRSDTTASSSSNKLSLVNGKTHKGSDGKSSSAEITAPAQQNKQTIPNNEASNGQTGTKEGEATNQSTSQATTNPQIQPNSPPVVTSVNNPVKVQLMSMKHFAKFRDAISKIQNSDSPPSYQVALGNNKTTNGAHKDSDSHYSDDVDDYRRELLKDSQEELDNSVRWEYPKRVTSSIVNEKSHSDSLSTPSTSSPPITPTSTLRRESYRTSRGSAFATVHEGLPSYKHSDVTKSNKDVNCDVTDDVIRPEVMGSMALAGASLHSSRDSSLSRQGSSFETVVLAEGFESGRLKGAIPQRKILGPRPQSGQEVAVQITPDRSLPRAATAYVTREGSLPSDVRPQWSTRASAGYDTSAPSVHSPVFNGNNRDYNRKGQDLPQYHIHSVNCNIHHNGDTLSNNSKILPENNPLQSNGTRESNMEEHYWQNGRTRPTENVHRPVQQNFSSEPTSRTFGSSCGVKVTPVPPHPIDNRTKAQDLKTSAVQKFIIDQSRSINQSELEDNERGRGLSADERGRGLPADERGRGLPAGNYSRDVIIQNYLSTSSPLSFTSDDIHDDDFDEDDDDCSNMVKVYDGIESKATVYDNVQYMNM